MIKAAAYNCEPLQDPFIFENVYQQISPIRRLHVDEAKNLKLKCERLGAAHLLEKMLWENHIERPYEYTYLDNGRPVLLKPEGIKFSLSHSNYVAVCCISDKDCGIDIEKRRTYDESLVKRFFTKNDLLFLQSQSLKEIDKKFTEVWTFKEAVAKMLNRPLVQVLQWIDYSIYCDCSKGNVEWIKQGFEFRDYYITLCYEDARQAVSMGLFDPYDGKYY